MTASTKTWVWRSVGFAVVIGAIYLVFLVPNAPVAAYVEYLKQTKITKSDGERPCVRCGKPATVVEYDEQSEVKYYCSKRINNVHDSTAHSVYLSQIGMLFVFGTVALWKLIASFRGEPSETVAGT